MNPLTRRPRYPDKTSPSSTLPHNPLRIGICSPIILPRWNHYIPITPKTPIPRLAMPRGEHLSPILRHTAHLAPMPQPWPPIATRPRATHPRPIVNPPTIINHRPISPAWIFNRDPARAFELRFAVAVLIFLDHDRGVGAQHAAPVAVAVHAAGAGLRGIITNGKCEALAARTTVDCSALGAESAEVFVWFLPCLSIQR